MVNPEAVVVVDDIAHIFVGSVRVQPEDEVAGQVFRELQFEGSLANIGGHEDTAEVITRLDVPEYHFSPIGHIDNLRVFLVRILALQIADKLLGLVLGPFPQRRLFLFLDLFIEE